MNQQRASTRAPGASEKRPEVLSDLTVTQLAELERQFDDGDLDAFNTRAASYGWSADQAQAVWRWFAAGRGFAANQPEVVAGAPVYPASGPVDPSGDAPARDMGAFGQGDRGIAGYEDHGESEPAWLPPSGVPGSPDQGSESSP
jgi:hypothetical protein